MRIWIDVDNAPHVAVFRPIIADLRSLGHSIEVTARDRTFVPEMLDRAGIAHTVVGRGQPRGFLAKASAIARRALALARHAAGRRLDVAVGHGSRSLPLAARLARVPNLTMFDYEHISTWPFRRFCDRILVPRPVLEYWNGRAPGRKWRPFEGFKEEIYLADWAFDPAIRDRLRIPEGEVLVVVRPPSRSAHYHEPGSERTLAALIAMLGSSEGTKTVWLRRDPEDPGPRSPLPTGFLVPDEPLDGPSLLAAADVVVSGGGTMTREAALLGTPSYSIFTGRQGVLDDALVRAGRLVRIADESQVERIQIQRKRVAAPGKVHPRLREFVVAQILEVATKPGAGG